MRVLWPFSEPLGGVLGPLGRSLAVLGTYWGCLWESGDVRRALDHSSGFLARLATLLGRSGGDLRRHFAARRFVICFGIHLGVVLGARWDQKESAKGARKEAKSKTKFKSIHNSLRDHLGAVLSRSWVILADLLRSKTRLFQWKSK